MTDGLYTALVAGGTGIVGREVVTRLAASPRYNKVVVLTRRAIEQPEAGVDVHQVDFETLCDGGELPQADHLYICLGTTQKVAGSPDAFRRVDHDYVAAVARAARAAGATRVALVSSVGANAGSSNFYLRTKGETEDEVLALGFERTTIARPGLLRGPRDNGRRVGESLAKVVSPVLDGFMRGAARKYHSIFPATVAKALIASTLDGDPGTEILEYVSLTDWARR